MTNMKDKAEHMARVAISYHRRTVINYWLDSWQTRNWEDMGYWAQNIQDLNDAQAYLHAKHEREAENA